jgi:Zn-dependent protease/predicted transcriptional regulator
MRWSLKIVRIAGTEIRIHITFLLFLAWIGLTYYRTGGPPAAAQGILFMLAIFTCVVLHEFGHIFAARWFGIRTPDITLLPIGGVARLQRMPDKPWQELIVALAGPLVNVVIAGVLVIILNNRTGLEDLEQLSRPGAALLPKLAVINILLAVFNMVPAFPMDGGRVLRAVLAMAMNYSRATQIAAWVGQALAVVFVAIGIVTPNPLLILIALFIYLGARQEAAFVRLRDLSENLRVSEAMTTPVLSLPHDATLNQAIEAHLHTAQHEFPIVDRDGRVLGILTRDSLIAAFKRDGPTVPVVDVMLRNLPVVEPDDPFDKAFRLMQESNSPALPVVDPLGHLLGLITPENVGKMMLVKSLRPGGRQPGWRLARAAT